jgi:GntR family transcriptional regulator, transcriptional repressor for pyruvate dehydrogenase complex
MSDQYESIRSERLHMKIIDQIQRRILAGELKVGDHLPPERDLAEQFQVSRTAVREAVKMLSEKGLVEIRPGRGTFVTNGTSQVARSSLGMMMKIVQADSTEDLVEVREILEPEIAALAAERAQDDHIDAMRQAVVTMDQSLDLAEPYIDADLDFHQALAKASDNPIILALIETVADLLREQRLRNFHVSGGPQRWQVHHKRILEAVAARQPEIAREEMRRHLAQVREDSLGKGALGLPVARLGQIEHVDME